MTGTAFDALSALLRGTALMSLAALIVAGLLAALKIRSSTILWRAWFAVLLCGLGFAPLTLRLPWLLEEAAPIASSDVERSETPPATVELHQVELPIEELSAATDAEVETKSTESRPSLTNNQTEPRAMTPPAEQSASPWPAVLLGVWSAGMAAILARGVWRYVRFLRSMRRCSPAPHDWSAEWQAILASQQVKRPVPMLVGEGYGPALCRLPRGYALVVPRGMWEQTSSDARDVILRHELAHYRRNDLVWSLVARWLAAPHWFNPFAHLAVRRLDEASEWACDDAATGGQAARQLILSKTLLGLSETPGAPGAMQAAVGGRSLAMRIRRLLEPTHAKDHFMRKLGLTAVVLAVLIAGWARVQLVAVAQDTEPPSAAPVQAAVEHDSVASVAPEYVIEPPDVLLIDSVKLVPKAPYKLEAFDVLFVEGQGLLPEAPLSGQYSIEPGGRVSLGPAYGSLALRGMSLEEAQQAIVEHLQSTIGIRSPVIAVRLASSSGGQLISGEHLVGPDGSVNLGSYGSVYVAGKTMREARAAIEAHLLEQVDEVKISVDVFKYNSKFCYVILEDDASGDQVIKLPLNGNETVLDAFALATENADVRIGPRTEVWIARAGRADTDQILPVALRKIMRGDVSATNYRLKPNDRMVISQPLKK